MRQLNIYYFSNVVFQSLKLLRTYIYGKFLYSIYNTLYGSQSHKIYYVVESYLLETFSGACFPIINMSKLLLKGLPLLIRPQFFLQVVLYLYRNNNYCSGVCSVPKVLTEFPVTKGNYVTRI